MHAGPFVWGEEEGFNIIILVGNNNNDDMKNHV